MLCILYVRNGEQYGGLRIREGEYRRSVSFHPISRTQGREMHQDISRKDQWRPVRPQATNAPDGGPRKRGRVGGHPARPTGEGYARSPQSAWDGRRKRGGGQIAKR